MRYSQMYPETRLRAKHLPLNRITIVTVERFDYETITNRQPGGMATPEGIYLMKLKEFRLPMKLPRPAGQTLARHFGDDVEHSIGRVIGIQPRSLKIGNDPEDKWTIDIYPVLAPHMRPTLPPNSEPEVQWDQQPGMPAIPIGNALPAGDAAPAQLARPPAEDVIGEEGATIVNELHKRGQTLPDFWAWWLGQDVPRQLHDAILGHALVGWPGAMKPWLRKFAKMFPLSAGDLLPSQATIMATQITFGVDIVTGEVIDPAEADPPAPDPAASQERPSDDDIPF